MTAKSRLITSSKADSNLLSANTRISRRQFVQSTAVSAMSIAGDGLRPLGAAQVDRPNILFIMADDLGYADVSCYGQHDYATPNIDRLAAEGMKFTQAYSNSSVCSATRTALITGKYQYRLPVGLEEPLNLQSPQNIGLPPSQPTLPAMLKKSGYQTTLIGKWHLGALPNFSPLKSGYEHFFGIWGGAADYFNHGTKSAQPLYEQEVPVDLQGYMTDLLADRATKVIEGYARSKAPFMLSLHFNAPHWPWEGPDDEAESKRIAGRLIHRDGGTQKTYMSMVQNMDRNIGRVLQALDSHGLTKNTIVVFTSDNGGERFSKTWPFSGMKYELLEGGIRIPAIVRWPAQISAGGVSDQVLMSMDWMPTLLAASRIEPDSSYQMDGKDLLAVLNGVTPSFSRKLYWRNHAGNQKALRDGDWKYLQIAGNEFLFNIVQDPRERSNLKNRNKETFERLKDDWGTWNSTMLPPHSRQATFINSGDSLADHYGVSNAK